MSQEKYTYDEYMPKTFRFENFQLWARKGVIWWGDRNTYCNNRTIDFSSQSTHDIIFWIIKNIGRRK
jgi:hypothetical protein